MNINNLIDSLNCQSNKFLISSKEIYNDEFLSSFNLNNGDDNIEILEISLFDFPKLQEKIEKGTETLESFCEQRFENKKKYLKKQSIIF